MIDNGVRRVGVDLDASERDTHGGGDRLETDPFQVHDEVDPATGPLKEAVFVAEQQSEPNGLVTVEELLRTRGDGVAFNSRSPVDDPGEHGLFDGPYQAIRMIDDLAIPDAHPLEETGIAQRRLGEAVGVRDDVHPNALPHHVEEVGGCPQLLADRVQVRCVLVQLVGEELGVEIPCGDPVQAPDNSRLPQRQQVNRVDRGGKRQGVLHHTPIVPDGSDVDADHVRALQPRRIGLTRPW